MMSSAETMAGSVSMTADSDRDSLGDGADMSEIVDDALACKDPVGEHKIANRVPERG
jgi:hypothetical protein